MSAPSPEVDPRITKRRVTMRRVTIDENTGVVYTHEAVDYVRPDVLDAFLAQARKDWQAVMVSEEPDAGPAGYDGPTYVPAVLDHELAGTYYPAFDCVNCSHAPAGAAVVYVPQEG